MKKNTLLLFLSLVITAKSMCQFADPAVNIVMQPSPLTVNSFGILLVHACNNGSTDIAPNSLEITVSMGSNSSIYSLQNIVGPAWIVFSNTTGTGNTYKLRNSQTITGAIGANPCSDINLKVRATVVSDPSNITANISYISGPNCNISPACPNNSSQGNLSTVNDNSTTSLFVLNCVGTTVPGIQCAAVPGCYQKLSTDQVTFPPLSTTNFGDFEAPANFNVLVLGNPAIEATKYESWKATTTLTTPAQYQIVTSADLVTGFTFLPIPGYNVAGNAGKMMVVTNPTVNAQVWALYDSAKWNPHPIVTPSNPNGKPGQMYFDTSTYAFAFDVGKVDFTANPQIRVNIWDDSTHTILRQKDFTISGNPGQIIRDSVWYKLPFYPGDLSKSKVKWLRIEILALTAGVPFSLDRLSMGGALANICPATTLPIKLLDFEATKLATSVLLNWTTTSESNSKNFEVQYSTDGVNWQTIGTVDAAGNSSTERRYSFMHDNPVKGINYYRLRMNDLDARYNFSEQRVAVFGGVGIGGIKVLPNPVMTRLYITTTSSINLQSVSVYSADGKLMQQNAQFATGGSVDMSQLAAGTYVLKITDKQGNTEMVKVVKMNK